jgi:peptide/nickel transport system substrate-binding protein
MAEVFAQQAKGAGVNVTVNSVGVDVLYGPNFLKWPFAQEWQTYEPYLIAVNAYMLPSSPYNETHFNNPRYTSLYNQALATGDVNKRKELAGEMQRIEHDEGGYITPIFTPIVDSYAASVHGLVSGRTGFPFNSGDFGGAWIA